MRDKPGPADVRVGLIADTHGLLRPEALDALRGCDHILHAGDIGSPDILPALAALAPVTAIRGNNDAAVWANDLPDTTVARLGGVAIHLIHDLRTLAAHPRPDPVDVILCGHSHRPCVERRDGRLLLHDVPLRQIRRAVPGAALPARTSMRHRGRAHRRRMRELRVGLLRLHVDRDLVHLPAALGDGLHRRLSGADRIGGVVEP